MSRYLGLGVLVFFVFIFALTLGATLTDRHSRLVATEHCQVTGGVWNTNNYCEKTSRVCEPQAL